MKRFLTFMMAMVSSIAVASILFGANAKQISSEKENIYFNEYSQEMGRSINFDDNWKFYFGEVPGAQQSSFDDSKWRSINLPHDYSIEQDFSRKNGNEGESGYLGGGIGWYRKTFHLNKDFDFSNNIVRIDFDGVYMNSDVYINGERVGNHPYGYTPFSYDITEHLNRGDNTIAVRVNHQVPSSRWYSGSGIYRSVHLTLANKLHVDLFGSKVIAPTLADNQADVDVSITTDIKNRFSTQKSAKLKYEIFERTKDGSKGALLKEHESTEFEIGGSATATIKSDFKVESPKLWSVDDPNLYIVKTSVIVGGEAVDIYEEDFGFRYFKFDPDLGFSLNGERMKLHGVSMHHDQGSLGAIANKDAQMRQIRILKEMGTNAIRVTHNPASQTLIDAANEMGMILIEEAFDGWDKAKNGNSYDYARFFNQAITEDNQILGKESGMTWSKFDLKMQIKRGSSDPSIIAWSLGNEIWEGVRTSHSDWPRIHRDLVAYVKTLDTSRAITTGDNKLKEHNRNSVTIAQQNADAGGIVGFNYAFPRDGQGVDTLAKYHSEHPDWPIYLSETSSAINSRGVYHTTSKRVDDRMELTSYDESKVGWGMTSSESWHLVQTRDYVAGEFIWTGFDYLGEPTEWNEPDPNPNGSWPAPKNSFFGIIDTAGLPKDRYYFYQSQWRDDITTLHMLPAWDKRALEVNDGDNVRVDVYSNAAEVRLYLDRGDGKVLLETSKMNEIRTHDGNGYYTYMAKNQGKNHRDLYHTFTVPYHDGKLIAEAYNERGEKIEATSGIAIRETAGKAHRIKATIEAPYETIKADNSSLAYIKLDVVDEKGNIVPNATNKIRTEVSGNGRFVSMDNGWQKDLTRFQSPERQAYNGSAIAIVGATPNEGEMMVTFTSPNLKPTTVKIKTKASGQAGPRVPVGVSTSKSYFVNLNGELSLPNTVDILYSNGEKAKEAVVWTGNDETLTKTPGVKQITGMVLNHKFIAYVNVIDKIGGVYSYTTNGVYGEVPTLPMSLEAFDDKGDKLGLSLPVKWDMPGKMAFEHYGEVRIKGTLNFLGQEIITYATVSIREKLLSHSNIAPEAMNKLEDRKNNDSFNAMFNNNIYSNGSFWTNFDASTKDNDTNSLITLEYATKTKASSVEITFFRDTYSVVYPRLNDLKIEYLEGSLADNSVWKNVEYKATEKDEITGKGHPIKTYVYTFNKAIDLTLIRFEINNHPTDHTSNFSMAVTGITEIMLMGETATTVIGSEAKLEGLIVNGYRLTEAELEKGSFDVSNSDVEVFAKGFMNSAVTILPKKDNKVVIEITSEDKLKTSQFVINLGVDNTIKPDFSAADYNTFASITAPKAQASNGLTVDKLKDNRNDTYYHSSWAAGDDLSLDTATTNNALIFELDREMEIAAIRYLPRQGENDWNGDRNGRILKYELYVAGANQEYREATKGEWANNSSWKIAQFKPTVAKYIKLVAKESFAARADEKNAYINCAEFRVVEAARVKTSIMEAKAQIEPTATINNPMINLTLGNAPLVRDYDYTVKFELVDNNNAKAIVKGINKYSGTKEFKFTLVPNLTVANVKVTGMKAEAYTGDILTLDGLRFEISYSNDTTFKATYNKYLAKRITEVKGFNSMLATGNNQLSFKLDNYLVELNVYAIRGDYLKAINDALRYFEVDLNNYKDINKNEYTLKLNALKSLKDSNELDYTSVNKAILDLENAYNKLVIKDNVFAGLNTRASLVISYNSKTLESSRINLRFGGRINNSILNKDINEYGVIVLAGEQLTSLSNIHNIKANELNILKENGYALEINPVMIDGKDYSQFAWVINNIDEANYGFIFTAFLYEMNKETGNVTLAIPKEASVLDISLEYVNGAAELNIPADVVSVLEKLLN